MGCPQVSTPHPLLVSLLDHLASGILHGVVEADLLAREFDFEQLVLTCGLGQFLLLLFDGGAGFLQLSLQVVDALLWIRGRFSDPLLCISLMLIIPFISICKYFGKDTNNP